MKSSHLLCERGADRNARTNRRTNVSKFARPAQELVDLNMQDSSVLHNIISCREYIRRGKPPRMPIPDDIEPSAQRNRANPFPSNPVHGQYGSRAMTTDSSAFSEDPSDFEVPDQCDPRNNINPSNAYPANQWGDDGSTFDRNLNMSPLSMSSRRGTMNSNSLDHSRTRRSEGDLLKTVRERNFRRAATMAPAQPQAHQHASTTAQAPFDPTPGTSSSMPNLRPLATQSVPNLAYYGSSSGPRPESAPAYPILAVSSGFPPADPLNSLDNATTGTADSSALGFDFGASAIDQPNGTSNFSTPAETATLLGFANSTPLSLAPQMMHSMQTYDNDLQYQAFPCWTENGQATVQPTIQPPPPQQPYGNVQRPQAPRKHHLGLPPGLAPMNPQQFGTLAPMMPLDATGANGYGSSARNTWFTCPHNEPVSYEYVKSIRLHKEDLANNVQTL